MILLLLGVGFVELRNEFLEFLFEWVFGLNLVQGHVWDMLTSRVHADSHDASNMSAMSTCWATTKETSQSTVLVSALVLKDALGRVSGAGWHVGRAISRAITLGWQTSPLDPWTLASTS